MNVAHVVPNIGVCGSATFHAHSFRDRHSCNIRTAQTGSGKLRIPARHAPRCIFVCSDARSNSVLGMACTTLHSTARPLRRSLRIVARPCRIPSTFLVFPCSCSHVRWPCAHPTSPACLNSPSSCTARATPQPTSSPAPRCGRGCRDDSCPAWPAHGSRRQQQRRRAAPLRRWRLQQWWRQQQAGLAGGGGSSRHGFSGGGGRSRHGGSSSGLVYGSSRHGGGRRPGWRRNLGSSGAPAGRSVGGWTSMGEYKRGVGVVEWLRSKWLVWSYCAGRVMHPQTNL